jgi:hypothetical protein
MEHNSSNGIRIIFPKKFSFSDTVGTAFVDLR